MKALFNLRALASVLLLAAAVMFSAHAAVTSNSSDPDLEFFVAMAEGMDLGILQEVETINEAVPIRIDRLTNLVWTKFDVENHLLTFTYTLNLDKTYFSEEEMDNLMDEMKPQLQAGVEDVIIDTAVRCMKLMPGAFTPEEIVAFMIAYDLKFRYVYYDANGSFIDSIDASYTPSSPTPDI